MPMYWGRFLKEETRADGATLRLFYLDEISFCRRSGPKPWPAQPRPQSPNSRKLLASLDGVFAQATPNSSTRPPSPGAFYEPQWLETQKQNPCLCYNNVVHGLHSNSRRTVALSGWEWTPQGPVLPPLKAGRRGRKSSGSTEAKEKRLTRPRISKAAKPRGPRIAIGLFCKVCLLLPARLMPGQLCCTARGDVQTAYKAAPRVSFGRAYSMEQSQLP